MKTILRLTTFLVITCSVSFVPSVCPAVQAADGVSIAPDVVYGHKDGLALTFDVYRPQRNSNGAGVLFMVSGGWYSRWFPPERSYPRFKPLVEKGFTVFAVRHGSSPRYSIPEAVSDVRRSVRYIRLHAKRFGVDADRLGVWGGSAGGHLSLMLGTASDRGNSQASDPVLRVSDRVAAVVAFFPPTDLRGVIWSAPNVNPVYKRFPALNLEAAKAAKASPLLHVSADDPPTLLVHGDQDTLVPISHSEQILAAFQKQKVICRLIVIKGAGHGFGGMDNQRAVAETIKWFEKHLRTPAAKKKQSRKK